MIDFIKINRLTERNFTEVFEAAGGKRYSDDDSKEKLLNADYLIGNAIVELKLVEEEGFDKQARQRRLSNIFTANNKSPVVVIDPKSLSAEDKRTYFNALEGPIKTHVKKASKQLKSTSTLLGEGFKKILLIVNNGYSAMDREEFRNVVKKCVENDTNNIDYVITCGIYYYSDGFDSYVFAPFEIEGIHDETAEPTEFKAIHNAWNVFSSQLMSPFFGNSSSENGARFPVLDLEFDVDDVTFVKPALPFGKESKFWVAGRPRINTTGIKVSPIVGMSFPKLTRASWDLMSNALADSWRLQNSYEEWVQFASNEEREHKNSIQPFVPTSLMHDSLLRLVEGGEITLFSDLCNYANDVFSESVRELALSSEDFNNIKTELDAYIFLVCQEIGRDQKNDLCSIYVAKNRKKPEVLAILIENKRIFFEHGLCLASAYALKHNLNLILHKKDKKYAWM